jgi:hypothetical protein
LDFCSALTQRTPNEGLAPMVSLTVSRGEEGDLPHMRTLGIVIVIVALDSI